MSEETKPKTPTGYPFVCVAGAVLVTERSTGDTGNGQAGQASMREISEDVYYDMVTTLERIHRKTEEELAKLKAENEKLRSENARFLAVDSAVRNMLRAETTHGTGTRHFLMELGVLKGLYSPPH